MQLVRTLTRVGIIAAAATMMATATPAFAASRDGVCDAGEFCYSRAWPFSQHVGRRAGRVTTGHQPQRNSHGR